MREGILFDWEYNELFDCTYKNHFNDEINRGYKKRYHYTDFLKKIYSGELEGYVVLSGLSIKKCSRTDFHGFLPIKTTLSQKNWSSFTNGLSKNLSTIHNVVIGIVLLLRRFSILRRTDMIAMS